MVNVVTRWIRLLLLGCVWGWPAAHGSVTTDHGHLVIAGGGVSAAYEEIYAELFHRRLAGLLLPGGLHSFFRVVQER
jgi:hypothetical protein